ncbi:MAG: hypothetical protein HYT94_01160 [Parcubacteria group bacterium]|nr:hypothetical protein [Parcubacteria group bacterium]
MKVSFGSHITKWLASFALLSFFAAAVFSIGIGMNMDEMGNMAPCAFMAGEAVVCPMGVTAHIDEWIGLFAPVGAGLAFSFAALLFLVFAFPFVFSRDDALWKKFQGYSRGNPFLKSLCFLVLLFSRGILNPRLYAFANI